MKKNDKRQQSELPKTFKNLKRQETQIEAEMKQLQAKEDESPVFIHFAIGLLLDLVALIVLVFVALKGNVTHITVCGGIWFLFHFFVLVCLCRIGKFEHAISNKKRQLEDIKNEIYYSINFVFGKMPEDYN
jgi:predicted membrane channel-forming protein YqfA (hemolysin III family)